MTPTNPEPSSSKEKSTVHKSTGDKANLEQTTVRPSVKALGDYYGVKYPSILTIDRKASVVTEYNNYVTSIGKSINRMKEMFSPEQEKVASELFKYVDSINEILRTTNKKPEVIELLSKYNDTHDIVFKKANSYFEKHPSAASQFKSLIQNIILSLSNTMDVVERRLN